MLEQIGTIVEFNLTDSLGWIELDQGGRVRFGGTSLRGIAAVVIGTRVVVRGTKPGYEGVPKAVAVVPLATPGAAEGLQGTVDHAPAVQARMQPVQGSADPDDRVRIVNLVDGTTIEGRDAVKAHFDKEKKLLDEHGSTIIFEVYRINLGAKTIAELQSKSLAEIKVGGDFVSGTDTVAAVKEKLRPLLEGTSRSGREAQARPDLNIQETDRISFSFSGRRMEDEKKFYADHFMMLPAWVQVLLHDCEHEELLELADKLRHAGRQ